MIPSVDLDYVLDQFEILKEVEHLCWNECPFGPYSSFRRWRRFERARHQLTLRERELVDVILFGPPRDDLIPPDL